MLVTVAKLQSYTWGTRLLQQVVPNLKFCFAFLRDFVILNLLGAFLCRDIRQAKKTLGKESFAHKIFDCSLSSVTLGKDFAERKKDFTECLDTQ